MALVLLDTGWGQANEATLTTALRAKGYIPSIVAYFPTTVGKAVAGSLAEAIIKSKADCAILLANSGNGAEMVNALGERNPDLRIFSHWGITGSSDFVDQVSQDRRSQMQIKVLQTCGLKREAEGNDVLRKAMSAGAPNASSLIEIPAAAGFVHGYDLGKILMAASRQASRTSEWRQDIISRRYALKLALEALERPVQGILKSYSPPFRQYAPDTPDAHEALGLEDLCLAQFMENGLLANAN